MSAPAILAAGAYAPDAVLTDDELAAAWDRSETRGIERRTVPAADEDALTMAWEATRRALDTADLAPDAVAWLGFATTTPPVEATDVTARLGSMLGLGAATPRFSFGGGTRAGTRALFAGMDTDVAGPRVVVASDCPRGKPQSRFEHAAGAGAAAFVLDEEGPAGIVDRSEYASPYPGTRFRRVGSATLEGVDVTSYERQARKETMEGAFSAVTIDAEDLDAAALQGPDGAVPYRVGGALGIEDGAIARGLTADTLGDTGAASVPLGLAVALEGGAERLLGLSYGSGGGSDAVVIERAAEVPVRTDLDGERELDYAAYLRRRNEITEEPPSGGGARVSVPSWRRTIPARHRLEAGRCPDCGAVAYPAEGACPGCRELVTYERTALPARGRVRTATTVERGGEPPEFAVQQAAAGAYAVGLVEFDLDGAVVRAPFQFAEAEERPSVGEPVELVIRRLYEQDGVIRYACKARIEH